jgi:hypothetical protein
MRLAPAFLFRRGALVELVGEGMFPAGAVAEHIQKDGFCFPQWGLLKQLRLALAVRLLPLIIQVVAMAAIRLSDL